MIFRGVHIDDWSGKHDDAGQKFELFMGADFSDKVREAMGWTIDEELASLFPKLRDKETSAFDRATMLLPANIKTIGLDGSLAAKSLDLIPNGKELERHKITLSCTEINSFSLHRTKQPNGSYEWELRFRAIVVQTGAAKVIEGYIEAVGSKPAQMPVGYEKQDSLGLDDGKEDAQQQLISREQAADTAAAGDEQKGPTLASAREAGASRGRVKDRKLEPVQ
jgi:hypothetical protein